ncbi:hypothetical protein ACH4E8_34270 [Streptomyces sp. NPDC017979]|uniref:hypothetical protein n=1 Tax=Streptomyces sp. NPDC017979 TaxID=3365024 RepID=UPI0037AD1498
MDWAALGVEPRWKDQETGDCAAVLSPVRGPATGLEPYKRYAAGARQRGETALVVACTGAGERRHNVFSGTVAPGIHLPDKLLKHLNTWPGLTGTKPVDGGVLVVNHQIKLQPAQRDVEVYTDRAFAEALTVPVIGSARLFDRWRRGDWDAVRHAVFGETGVVQPPESATPDADPKASRRPGLLSRLRR